MSVTPGDLHNTGVSRAALTRAGTRPLTSRQAEVLGLIRRYVTETGQPAPAAFLARHLGMTHQGALHHLAALHSKGALVTAGTPATPRGPVLS